MNSGKLFNRRRFLRDAVLTLTASSPLMSSSPACSHRSEPVMTGADYLARNGFEALAGKRVGLITNQTGRSGGQHLADLIHASKSARLTAIFAPEHGFRGAAEAGAHVEHGRDAKIGAPIFSLYGATRKPGAEMLRDVDVLVFDIQDVGVRFYTYISTMGLAMQAAAARGIPFFVLDRPNPLGGIEVSGFVRDAGRQSFVGQYPIPIMHGLTVGELAQMIQGERWLAGLEESKLTVVAMKGWDRASRWSATGLEWVPTSPNIPSFHAALAYPGIGLVGETLVNEGRGTPLPFLQFGAPWLEGNDAARKLNGLGLPGVLFEPVRLKPVSIPNVAAHPRFEGQSIDGLRIAIKDEAAYRPVEVGMHVLALLHEASKKQGAQLFGKLDMFHATAGTTRLYNLVSRGASGLEIVGSWQNEVDQFRRLRQRYLLY